MTITIFSGLPCTGKTSEIIRRMNAEKEQGEQPVLFLSSDNEILTRRPNVHPGGIMGCRTPGLSANIDHVVSTELATTILDSVAPGRLAVFDEAQYFDSRITDAWKRASDRGVRVLVGCASAGQLERLDSSDLELIEMKVDCQECGERDAERPLIVDDPVFPSLLCLECLASNQKARTKRLLERLHEDPPFPGEDGTYQPIYGVDMSSWQLVRGDSPARTALVQEAIRDYSKSHAEWLGGSKRPRYLDLGCCVGYFCQAMREWGFESIGVDVTQKSVEVAQEVAHIRGHDVEYHCEDGLKFLQDDNREYDVTSSYATVQWLMDQQGYQAGVECLELLFKKTKHICVLEMGYTTEETYKNRITDRPVEIDKDWCVDVLEKSGEFERIVSLEAGTKGIWRDLFIAFRRDASQSAVSVDSSDALPAHVARSLSVAGVDVVRARGDFWRDGWVGRRVTFTLRAKRPLSVCRIVASVPATFTSESSVAISLDKRVAGSIGLTQELAGEGFRCQVSEGAEFELTLECCNTQRPKSEDLRELSFLLHSVEFA